MGPVLNDVSLSDVYEREEGWAYVTGTQALLLLCLQQRRLDRRAGLNTAGFVSGYRGSPLSSLDSEAWRARATWSGRASASPRR